MEHVTVLLLRHLIQSCFLISLRAGVSEYIDDELSCLKEPRPLAVLLRRPAVSFLSSWYGDTPWPCSYRSHGRTSHACSLEHAVSVDSTKRYPLRLESRPPTAKDDTVRGSWSDVCSAVCKQGRGFGLGNKSFNGSVRRILIEV